MFAKAMNRLWLWLKVAWAAILSKSNKDFYDRIALIYDEVFQTHRIHAVSITKTLSDFYANKVQQTVVVDLGCGTGMLAKMLVDRGFRVIGLDISFNSIHILEKQDTLVLVAQANAERLPIVSDCLQSVACLGVWRHFNKPDKVLDEITRVLSPEGTLIVGYFPPAIAGVINAGRGLFGSLLRSWYQSAIGKLGYIDRADTDLEKEVSEMFETRFKVVNKIQSGQNSILFFAQSPLRT